MINCVVDDNYILESRKNWAPNIITAFASIGGRPIGVDSLLLLEVNRRAKEVALLFLLIEVIRFQLKLLRPTRGFHFNFLKKSRCLK